MAKAYEVNGVTVSTLKEVAEALNVAKVTTKDIVSGQYPDVYIMDTEDLATMEEALDFMDGKEDTTDEVTTDEDVKEFLTKHIEIITVGDAPTDGVLTNSDGEEPPTPVDAGLFTYGDDAGNNPDLQEEEVLANEELPTDDEVDEDIPLPTPESSNGLVEDIEYPEIGYFEDEKAMKKYVKKLTNEQLTEWCEIEGATWKANDHEAINRMRQAMAIKALHFPDLAPKAGKAKSKSKYADYTTEDLVQMALEADVEVKDDKGDMRILRMYTIMALKSAGLLPA